MLTVKPLVPHLPGFFVWLFLTLCTGWIAGRWAAYSLLSQKMASISSSPVSLLNERSHEGVTPPPPEGAEQEQKKIVQGKPYLGIRGKEIRQGEIRGVKVIEVFPGAPAAEAGLRADQNPVAASLPRSPTQSGHIIIGANGQIIRSEENLAKVLAQSTPGSILTLLVVSEDGNSYEIIPVTLGVAPDPSSIILTAAEENRQPTMAQETQESGVHR